YGSTAARANAANGAGLVGGECSVVPGARRGAGRGAVGRAVRRAPDRAPGVLPAVRALVAPDGSHRRPRARVASSAVIRGEPVWRDPAGSGVLAALDPGVPEDFDDHPDVLVVGGGAVGLATAALCSRAGLGTVAVIERDRLASGASGGAAALLTPEAHVWTDPAPFVALARRSLELL